MIIFLDYDGVLHPDQVYRRVDGRIELRAPGQLFMWSPLLIEALTPYPELRIVLSTSWVQVLGYRRARKSLPPALAERVIGATWHSAMAKGTDGRAWDQQSRYEQIAAYISRHPESLAWLAIDDDAEGWPSSHYEQLIQTNPSLGLSAPEVQNQLRAKLAHIYYRTQGKE